MYRREFIASALALASHPVLAHTPYAQWDSFRKRHLQILTARSDLIGDSIADDWVAVLKEHLPSSKAVVSRARNFVRVASLLKTDQAKLAVLSYSHAKAMFTGSPPFDSYSPLPLKLLVDDGKYLLVARDDLPLEHGYLLAITLMEHTKSLTITAPLDGMFGMSIHPGARSAALGETIVPVQSGD